MMFYLEKKMGRRGKGERRQFLKHLKSCYVEERDLLWDQNEYLSPTKSSPNPLGLPLERMNSLSAKVIKWSQNHHLLAVIAAGLLCYTEPWGSSHILRIA